MRRQDSVIEQALKDSLNNTHKILKDSKLQGQIESLAMELVECLKQGGKILIAGDGGSHSSALHFAEELTGRFRKTRPALAALALCEASTTTCVGNDFGFENVLLKQAEALAKPHDVLILLSTNGMSTNLIATAEDARCHVVALLGAGGGLLLDKADVSLAFPGETSDRIQELHMFTLHLLVELIEREMFPELYP